MVPVDHVIAIYARENGQGMAFPVPTDTPAGMTAGPTESATAAGSSKAPKLTLTLADVAPAAAEPAPQEGADDGPPEPPSGGRPTLKRIK